MGRQTVTTTERDYDADGRLVKETVTESVYDWADPPLQPYVAPVITPYPYPGWQTTYGQDCIGGTHAAASPGIHYTVNGGAPDQVKDLIQWDDARTAIG